MIHCHIQQCCAKDPRTCKGRGFPVGERMLGQPAAIEARSGPLTGHSSTHPIAHPQQHLMVTKGEIGFFELCWQFSFPNRYLICSLSHTECEIINVTGVFCCLLSDGFWKRNNFCLFARRIVFCFATEKMHFS